MRFPYPLRYSIPMALGALSVVLVSIDFAFDWMRINQSSNQEAVAWAAGLGNLMTRNLERLMAREDATGTVEELSALSGMPNLRLALVSDDKNHVRFSTDTVFLDLEFTNTTVGAAFSMVQKARKTMIAQIELSPDETSVIAVFPFKLGLLPGELRSSRTGTLYLEVDLELARKKDHVAVVNRALIMGTVAIVGATVFWLYLRSTVTRRVMALVRVTQDLAVGKLSARAVIPGSDEIASLAESFNQMAKRLDEGVQERFRAGEALRESQERFSLVNRVTFDVIWDENVLTGSLWWSDHFQTVFGYGPDDGPLDVAFWRRCLHPDDLERVGASGRGGKGSEGDMWFSEYRFRCRDGGYASVEDRAYLVRDEEGRVKRRLGAMRDITLRKLGEEKLRQSLAEKDTLLREVHHRVKNNLQIISSLFHFQSKKATNVEELSIFREGHNRLRAMILVHEQLYRSTNLHSIRFDEYVRSLAGQLERSFHGQGGRVRLELALESIVLPAELALPCGMIVTELVTNAFKYAYPGSNSGVVQIRATASDSGIDLSVADEGVGLPKGFEPTESRSFGWQLVHNLTEQLGATLSLERTRGTQILIRVPCPDSEGTPAPLASLPKMESKPAF